jgi:hypothetical protein
MSSNIKLEDAGLFDPPPGFALVEAGVYRSATPTEESLHFLQTLKFRCVVFLSPEALPKHFQDFVTAHGIAVSHLGLKMWQEGPEWKAVSDDLVKESLEMVLDVALHPVCVFFTYVCAILPDVCRDGMRAKSLHPSLILILILIHTVVDRMLVGNSRDWNCGGLSAAAAAMEYDCSFGRGTYVSRLSLRFGCYAILHALVDRLAFSPILVVCVFRVLLWCALCPSLYHRSIVDTLESRRGSPMSSSLNYSTLTWSRCRRRLPCLPGGVHTRSAATKRSVNT